MICEICEQREATKVINLGLDVGYHFGDYGKGDYKKFQVKPSCINVTSINLCSKCKSIIEQNKYFNVNIIDKLKKLIKTEFIRHLIIEGLK